MAENYKKDTVPDHGFAVWALDRPMLEVNRRYHDHIETAKADARAAVIAEIRAEGEKRGPSYGHFAGHLWFETVADWLEDRQ
jgi:hypothetical protein